MIRCSDQRIIYDDQEEWTTADLNLLQVGAPAIPFSRSAEVIYRLAGDIVINWR